MEINKAENWVSSNTGYPLSIEEYTGTPFNFHLDSYTSIEEMRKTKYIDNLSVFFIN